MAERRPHAPALINGERSLCGWGQTTHSRATVFQARDTQEVAEALACAARSGSGLIARGAGRSYGDAAQNAGGDVLDTTGLDRIVSVDENERLVTAQAGATVAALLERLAVHGLTLPVVPGTRHVTLGGAIASDIHGKNHHRDGGLARHVVALSLCTPARGPIQISPEADPELFFATLGGMGLTGIIVQATLRAEPLTSLWLAADVDRTDSLEQTLELMSAPGRHRYSVAWLDLLADGAKMGRAVVSQADPLWADGATPRRNGHKEPREPDLAVLGRRPVLEVPSGFPFALLRPAGMRSFNAMRWRAAPRRERGRPVARAPYLFPLDRLGQWNRLYGPTGLIQYQFVIPAGQEAALERCFALIRGRRLPVYLAVFKRFGAFFGGPLSFPIEGWTLAIDLPAAAPGLFAALDQLDEIVAACGGRVYLTKDARLRPDALPAMYPQLDCFRTQQARVDPDGVLRSDLARRLGLCGTAR